MLRGDNSSSGGRQLLRRGSSGKGGSGEQKNAAQVTGLPAVEKLDKITICLMEK